MIRAIRAQFLSRALREKILLVAFAGIGLVIWISHFSDQAGRFWRLQRTTAVALNEQEQYLRDKPRIEEAARKAAAQLEPSKTLDGTRLFTTIQQLASEAGLGRNLREDPPSPPETNGQLAVNNVRFQISNAEWEPLKKFYFALQQRSPYVALVQAQLVPNRANPGQVTFVATVSSVEVVR